METIKEVFNAVLETLFPSEITCFLCGNEVYESKFCLCDKCEKELPVVKKRCLRCGSPIYSDANYCLTCKNTVRHFNFARSPLIYKEGIAKAIKDFKYEKKTYLAKYFGRFLFEEFNKFKETHPVDLIVPIPLSNERFKERGFNQSELLANELSALSNIPVDSTSLIRVKNTSTQTALSFQERQENLENAFKVENKNAIKGKVVLLVDDVLTTGSTVSHAGETLKKAGAKAIYVLTLATTDSDKT